MANPDKVREDRLRRMAQRQGLRLMKSRRRDPRAYDYGVYMITDAQANVVVGGNLNGYGLDLDEVEAYLTREPAAAEGQARRAESAN